MQPTALQGTYHQNGVKISGPIQTVHLATETSSSLLLTICPKTLRQLQYQTKALRQQVNYFTGALSADRALQLRLCQIREESTKALLDTCGTDDRLTSADHPQANGLTARTHQSPHQQ